MTMKYRAYDESEALVHHGVLGMKWGVRKDGMPQGWQGGSGKRKPITKEDQKKAIEKGKWGPMNSPSWERRMGKTIIGKGKQALTVPDKPASSYKGAIKRQQQPGLDWAKENGISVKDLPGGNKGRRPSDLPKQDWDRFDKITKSDKSNTSQVLTNRASNPKAILSDRKVRQSFENYKKAVNSDSSDKQAYSERVSKAADGMHYAKDSYKRETAAALKSAMQKDLRANPSSDNQNLGKIVDYESQSLAEQHVDAAWRELNESVFNEYSMKAQQKGDADKMRNPLG